MRAVDLTGQRFGRLTAVQRTGSKNGNATWLCECDCGNKVIVVKCNLTNGDTRSCGCLRREIPNNKTHGKSNTRLYKIYHDMVERCYRPSNKRFKRYGARGIIVCDEWLNDIQCFFKWAETNGYKDNLQIDRIDNNGNYCPSNCKWSTRKEQANNTSRNHYITYNGETKTLVQWSVEYGLNRSTLYNRVCIYHWDIEKALKTPAIKRKTNKKVS